MELFAKLIFIFRSKPVFCKPERPNTDRKATVRKRAHYLGRNSILRYFSDGTGARFEITARLGESAMVLLAAT
jgi:hypothetical protein